MFRKNVTNLYVDRKELDRDQTTNPADVFKGMNGVYSMDSRNGASISPNIRGLSGQGRIPVTVDGTEQSTDTAGRHQGRRQQQELRRSGEPFRSVTVEKGPSLTRGVKSGVGGAVSIRTIEPSDIIPAGESLGIELKAETSGKMIGRGIDPSSIFGQDYRNIPGATARASGAVDIPMPPPRSKDGGDVLNFKDRSVLFTIAGRNDAADALLSYSERTKGNYFAGKNGAGGYRNNDAYAKKHRGLSSQPDQALPSRRRGLQHVQRRAHAAGEEQLISAARPEDRSELHAILGWNLARPTTSRPCSDGA